MNGCATRRWSEYKQATDKLEEALFSGPPVRLAEKGRVKGKNLHIAYYGHTAADRYLVVSFVRRRQTAALPIPARDMRQAERRYYHLQHSPAGG